MSGAGSSTSSAILFDVILFGPGHLCEYAEFRVIEITQLAAAKDAVFLNSIAKRRGRRERIRHWLRVGVHLQVNDEVQKAAEIELHGTVDSAGPRREGSKPDVTRLFGRVGGLRPAEMHDRLVSAQPVEASS